MDNEEYSRPIPWRELDAEGRARVHRAFGSTGAANGDYAFVFNREGWPVEAIPVGTENA